MQKNKKITIFIILLMLTIIAIGCKNTRQTSLKEEKNKADNYLKDTIKVINKNFNTVNMKKIEFVTFAKGNGESFRELHLNYNSNYNNNMIGKEVLNYSKEYFKVVMKDSDVQKLEAVSLYFQLRGVDENGHKPNSAVSITIYLSELENVDIDTLTIEDLQKIAKCNLDPTQPV